MKITREMALSATFHRLAFIASARYRGELRRFAGVGREDLDLSEALGLISKEEKIQFECQLSQAVQQRLTELMPSHLRLVHTARLVPSVADDQLNEVTQ